MGTLFNQPHRDSFVTEDKLIAHGEKVKYVSKELGISFSESLELYKAVAEISGLDTKDEQLAGFGEILQDIAANLKREDF